MNWHGCDPLTGIGIFLEGFSAALLVLGIKGLIIEWRRKR